MFNIKLLNKIAKIGTDNFSENMYCVSENSDPADAILVRSADLHQFPLNPELKCIARAGAGVNNIPIDKCGDAGVVVFNTPGANANGVKELVIASLLLASRDIYGGIKWSETLAGDPEAAQKVEKGKSMFAGNEIFGKTLGIVGLGAIGRLVANAAVALGMNVIGYDPYLSKSAAAQLDNLVIKSDGYDELFAVSDYISIHVPSTSETKGMFDSASFKKMKDGVKLINLSRADLVNSSDLISALETNKVAKYIVDFPTPDIIAKHKNIITIPHLGASTDESEDNCAIMAAKQTIDYLENGNIVNSVNYPFLNLLRSAKYRVCVLGKNFDPAKISDLIPALTGSANSSNNNYSYAVFDTDHLIEDSIVTKIQAVSGVIKLIVL